MGRVFCAANDDGFRFDEEGVMKKVGIVGGLGPESTLDYYRGIIAAFKPTFEDHGYPEIAIESINLKTVMYHFQRSAWDTVAAFIASKFEALRIGGADFGVIASNTPHRVFDTIQAQTFLPLLSIVDATLNYSKTRNLSRLCLLGTKFTMGADFYQHIFEKENIRLFVPNTDEQEYIQEKIFSEVEFGVIKEETKKDFLAIIDRIVKSENIEGVILGCTELPLLIKAEDISVQYIDTTQIHIAGIVDVCRRNE
jgi:aspartate racemase